MPAEEPAQQGIGPGEQAQLGRRVHAEGEARAKLLAEWLDRVIEAP